MLLHSGMKISSLDNFIMTINLASHSYSHQAKPYTFDEAHFLLDIEKASKDNIMIEI